MAQAFLSILTNALLPILAIVGFGFGLQRWRPMESKTLVTLNLYFFVPVYLFVRVLDSTLSWLEIGKVGFLVLAPVAVLGVGCYFLLRQFSLSGDTIAALLVGGLFANCGNFGVPVAELAFGPKGGEVQAIIVLFANFSIFSIAYTMLAMGKGKSAGAILNYFRLPYFYCVVAALVIRDTGLSLPQWVKISCDAIAAGLVPMALATLGAQLASRARKPNWKLLSPTLVVKLAILPIASFLTVWMLGLWPWPGVVIVLASSAPTAINPLLLAMQLDGDTDTLSDCVFWSTLFSAITVAVWMAILKSAYPEAFL